MIDIHELLSRIRHAALPNDVANVASYLDEVGVDHSEKVVKPTDPGGTFQPEQTPGVGVNPPPTPAPDVGGADVSTPSV